MTHHHHHEHVHVPQSLNRVFIFSILLNTLFVLIEAGVGFFEGSLGLLSDAGHNLSDVFSLLLVLIAFKLSALHSNRKYTYGYKKSSVLISLLNAIILLVAVGAIVIESIHKFYQPTAINGAAVSWTAGAGIVINGLTALLLMHGQREDLNVRGAFLHMAADTLVSVGVLVSGIVISATGWYVIDPIISLIIAAVILISTWDLLHKSLRLSLDGTPVDVDLDAVEHAMSDDPRVEGVHHVHVWAISTTENALTAHVVLKDIAAMDAVRHDLKHRLTDLHISHSTLEMEGPASHCNEQECECDHHEH